MVFSGLVNVELIVKFMIGTLKIIQNLVLITKKEILP